MGQKPVPRNMAQVSRKEFVGIDPLPLFVADRIRYEVPFMLVERRKSP